MELAVSIKDMEFESGLTTSSRWPSGVIARGALEVHANEFGCSEVSGENAGTRRAIPLRNSRTKPSPRAAAAVMLRAQIVCDIPPPIRHSWFAAITQRTISLLYSQPCVLRLLSHSTMHLVLQSAPQREEFTALTLMIYIQKMRRVNRTVQQSSVSVRGRRLPGSARCLPSCLGR